MASTGEKSLAVGHIPGFQIDPNKTLKSVLFGRRIAAGGHCR